MSHEYNDEGDDNNTDYNLLITYHVPSPLQTQYLTMLQDRWNYPNFIGNETGSVNRGGCCGPTAEERHIRKG